MEELFAMLTMPDAYDCYWHNGEIYLSRATELAFGVERTNDHPSPDGGHLSQIGAVVT